MTKQAELDSLDAFIASLPADTYLAPWLKSTRDEVARCIRCDIFPDVSLADAAKLVKERQETAATFETEAKARISQHGERIIAHAKETAAKIIESAERQARLTTSELEGSILQLRRALDRVA